PRSSTRPLSSLLISNETPPTYIYTLSLHDALPISSKALGKYNDNLAEIQKQLSALEEKLDRMAPIGRTVKVVEAQLDEMADFNQDRKSTRLNSSHVSISYAVFCLKKKKKKK